MGFLDALFGRRQGERPGAGARPEHANSTGFSPSVMQLFPTGGVAVTPQEQRKQFVVRRDLLRLVLRDITTRQGIPPAWLELRALPGATPRPQQTGLHARLLLKEWQPIVLQHAPSLERMFITRLMGMDPMADEWLLGLTWQLALPETTQFEPLPRMGGWTAPMPRLRPVAPVAPVTVAQGADVIAGPIRIGGAADAKANLDRLLTAGDGRQRGSGFDVTRPAALS